MYVYMPMYVYVSVYVHGCLCLCIMACTYVYVHTDFWHLGCTLHQSFRELSRMLLLAPILFGWWVIVRWDGLDFRIQ